MCVEVRQNIYVGALSDFTARFLDMERQERKMGFSHIFNLSKIWTVLTRMTLLQISKVLTLSIIIWTSSEPVTSEKANLQRLSEAHFEFAINLFRQKALIQASFNILLDKRRKCLLRSNL